MLVKRNEKMSDTEERLVRPSEFMERLGIKKTKFYQSIKEGKLPKPVGITRTTKVWHESVVRQTIRAITLGELSL